MKNTMEFVTSQRKLEIYFTVTIVTLISYTVSVKNLELTNFLTIKKYMYIIIFENFSNDVDVIRDCHTSCR